MPPDLEALIINGFPPNPRKIKRVLSLAYFIGKNIKIPINQFEEVFPLVVIWSVITLYFHGLADILVKSPYLLSHICVVVANTLDIGNLELKLDRYQGYQKWYEDNADESVEHGKFVGDKEFDGDELTGEKFFPPIYKKIDPVALTFAKEHLIKNTSLYRFLKYIAKRYNINRNPDRYTKINHALKTAIDSAGLLS